MWLEWSSGVDAAIAAGYVNRRYLRLSAIAHADGHLLSSGQLVDEDTVADEDVGPFASTLPGRRSGNLVTDHGDTERFCLPVETIAGWAIPLPDGWTDADIPGLPTGYSATETIPPVPEVPYP